MSLRSLFLVALGAIAANFLVAMHLTGDFTIRVVDQMRQGVPNVRMISDTGIVCGTDGTGTVRWNEAELMGRDVKFRIEKLGYLTPADGVTLRVHHFGRAVITISASK